MEEGSMRLRFLPVLLILVLCICSCSIEIQQAPPQTPSVESALNSPTQTPIIIEQDPGSAIPSKKQVPITWGNLDLTGRLVYISVKVIENSLQTGIEVLDLGSGEVTTVFTAPAYGVIYDLALSPDGRQLLMSYSPPAEDVGISYRGIYVMPFDRSAPPRQLFAPANPGDESFQVEWSPDGKYIYYTNFNYEAPPREDSIFPLYTIYRISYPDGAPEKIAENSLWTRASPDSSQIAYVQYVGSSLKNELYVANADGGNPRKVALTGARIPDIIDAPMFLPDGQSILFSSPVPPQAYKPGWFDKLMGVQMVRAHNVASDWWMVPSTGGQPVQLTNIQSVGLFASISPDKKRVASSSGAGIFVMDLDGSNLTQLLSDPSVQGVVRWIP
jgi:Tol biopolymer transport system component